VGDFCTNTGVCRLGRQLQYLFLSKGSPHVKPSCILFYSMFPFLRCPLAFVNLHVASCPSKCYYFFPFLMSSSFLISLFASFLTSFSPLFQTYMQELCRLQICEHKLRSWMNLRLLNSQWKNKCPICNNLIFKVINLDLK
jgi:hypothetical protein